MKKIWNQLLTDLVMFICSYLYREEGQDIFYINGTGKDHPNYLLYTQKKETRDRMARF